MVKELNLFRDRFRQFEGSFTSRYDITTYSPLRHWKVGPGQKVGVVGLGGLGHMGVKFARAFGAPVVVFTTSPSKKEDAIRLGAHEVVISRNSQRQRVEVHR